MKMAQKVQTEMQKAQANLDKIEVEGASGGGLVKIRATAKGRILGVDLDESLLAALGEDDGRGSDRGRDKRCRDQSGSGRRARAAEDDAGSAAAAGLQAAVLNDVSGYVWVEIPRAIAYLRV